MAAGDAHTSPTRLRRPSKWGPDANKTIASSNVPVCNWPIERETPGMSRMENKLDLVLKSGDVDERGRITNRTTFHNSQRQVTACGVSWISPQFIHGHQ